MAADPVPRRGAHQDRLHLRPRRDARPPAAKELYIVDYDGFNRGADHRQQLAQHPARLEPGRPLAWPTSPTGRARPTSSSAAHLRGASSDNLTNGWRRRPSRPSLHRPTASASPTRATAAGNMDDLGRERGRQRPRAAHHQRRPRHRAHLEPHRPGDRVHLGPRGHARRSTLMDSRGPERAPARPPSATGTTPPPGTRRSSSARSPTPPAWRRAGFDIAVIDLATRQVRQVTEGRGSCEYPSWAPSGRHLVFRLQARRQAGRSRSPTATAAIRHHARRRSRQRTCSPDWGP